MENGSSVGGSFQSIKKGKGAVSTENGNGADVVFDSFSVIFRSSKHLDFDRCVSKIITKIDKKQYEM